jgi:proteic killer suppression protein
MIRSFASADTERFFWTGVSRRIPPEIRQRARARLQQLDAATKVADLRSPRSNHLEALSGDRRGSYSIRVNEQWRICFLFESKHAYEVEIIDYH